MKITIEVPNSILHLAEQLRTQDNASTENPVFMVQEWRGIEGWAGVQAFLTSKAAHAYLVSNLHNLKRPNRADRQPRVYVEGGFRNFEREALRRFLMTLPPPSAAAFPCPRCGGTLRALLVDDGQTFQAEQCNSCRSRWWNDPPKGAETVPAGMETEVLGG